MKIKNRFIYKLTDRLGTLVVVPLGESDFVIEYEREDEEKRSYKLSLSGKIKLTDDKANGNFAFSRIMEMENSVYRCDEQILTIFKICNGVEKQIFAGKISLNEGDFNLDRCEVVLSFLEDNSDKCYNDNKSTNLNLFQLIFNRVIAKTGSLGGSIESKVCSAINPVPQTTFFWCGSGNPEDGNWIATNATASNSPAGNHFNVSTTWKREIIEINCSETPDSDWVLVEDNCGTTGKKKFAKKVELINCNTFGNAGEDNGANYSFNYSCDVLGYDNNLTSIDNGILFKDAMTELILAACPNLTLKSDFFQINPDNLTSTNYVTGKISKVNNIVLFQKSDVKRPTAYNNATKFELNLEDMLEVLFIMFNVKWRIEGNYFRLEHVSYYSRSIGIDVTSNELKKWFVGRRAYSYESAKIPQKETFKFKEQQGSDWNLEVTYSGCVSGDKKNEVTNIIDDAMTDIVFAMNNPEPDNKFVEDTGFVLVSTRKVNDEYFINSEASTAGSRLNNVFAWVQLFRDYHHHERPMKSGKVNGVLTEFLTTIPTKKGQRFSIPLDICSVFNPDDFIKTALGNGILSSGKYRMKDSMIELELLYESNQNLVPNNPPELIGGGVYQTYQDVSKLIPIQVVDGDGFITGINVVVPPIMGTVNVNSFSEIEYIPNAGVTGLDLFSLQAVDNISEVSNMANFAIEILPENSPPIAVDDEYFVWIGEAFNQGISIFDNDTDDFNSIVLTTPTVTTDQGILINIDSNGFFNYSPPSGFEGTDFFEYEIEDDLGNTSSAKVNLIVGFKNKPIGVEDNYQTLKNTVFSADGLGVGKQTLIFNDYTPDGLIYIYTATAETKATANGGSVTISADGTFVFTPLTGFEGIDTFDYTVNNSNGSGTGTAKISVLPTIYVKMTTNDLTQIGSASSPYWKRSQDYILSFFSDSAGLVPFDVTGLNFRVKIKHVQNVDDNGTAFTNTNIFETDFLSGVSMKILDNFTILENTNSGGIYHNENSVITIEDGSYIKI